MGQKEAVKRLDFFFFLSLSLSLLLSLSLSLFLIGIEWNVRCLVNVLNPFKQKKGTNFHHNDLATCCWIASEVNLLSL